MIGHRSENVSPETKGATPSRKRFWLVLAATVCLFSWLALGAGILLDVQAGTMLILATQAAGKRPHARTPARCPVRVCVDALAGELVHLNDGLGSRAQDRFDTSEQPSFCRHHAHARRRAGFFAVGANLELYGFPDFRLFPVLVWHHQSPVLSAT